MDAAWDMRAFVRVVEHQSFSAAAGVLGLTPSAVSKLVSRLEERLSVRLLHRTTRRLALTSEGEVYFARARHILSDIDEAEAEVACTSTLASPSPCISSLLHCRTSSRAIRISRWTCRLPTA
jgi:DNA-binding transcriptional LysR family regulator